MRDSQFAFIAQAYARTRNIHDAITAAELIEDESDQADTIVTVAQQLDQEQTAEFDRLVEQVKASDAITLKAQVLCRLSELLTQKQAPEKGLDIWKAAFNGAETRGREEMWELLGTGAGTLAAVDGGATLWNIYQAVSQIETWWKPARPAPGENPQGAAHAN